LRVRWLNFRCFEDTRWFDIRPLTVIIGANNTGKTTLYQPLLLLSQTLRSKSSDPLIIRGDLVDLGHYEHIVFRQESSRNIAFQFDDLDPPDPSLPPLPSMRGSSRPAGLALSFAQAERAGANLESFEVLNREGERLLARRRKKNGRYSLGGMPSGPWQKINRLKSKRYVGLRELRQAILSEEPTNFLFNPQPYTTRVATQLQPGSKPTRTQLEAIEWTVTYAILLAYIWGTLGRTLRSVSYLGPLRMLPQRWYELSGEAPTTVGRGGVYAPEILYRAQETQLISDVQAWLAEFGFASELRFRELESDSFSLELRRPRGRLMNLADTGVGVSQVLPLIVQGLHAAPSDIVVFEQPEIHLNPKLQSKLADLFALFANEGRRLIVETHSEHILLALRRLVAQGDLTTDKLGLYYTSVEKGRSKVRQIAVKPDGSVPRDEWPTGFFEESLTGALALSRAQAERRASAR
jgi:putative AbiEii toxin of type IV toxin-antitoxin system/AAA ATPase-like protein